MIARTKEEIEILREGGRRLAHHVRVLGEMVAPGLPVIDIERRAAALIEEFGDRSAFYKYPSGRHDEQFPGVICVSINDAVEHGPAAISDYVIEEGDVVSLDFGIIHRGLYTDHGKTFIAGKGSETDARLLHGTQEALAAGIREARVGATTGDIGYAVEQVARKYKFGFPTILAGHGVGAAVHEEPTIPNFGQPHTGARLRENEVIAIEPMMTFGRGDLFVDKDNFTYRTKDRSRAAHFEHTLIVTANGPEILTKE